MWPRLMTFVLDRISEIEEIAWRAKERQVSEPRAVEATEWLGVTPDQVLAVCQMKRTIIRHIAEAQVSAEVLTASGVDPKGASEPDPVNLHMQRTIASAHRSTLVAMARLWVRHPEYREAVSQTADDFA